MDRDPIRLARSEWLLELVFARSPISFAALASLLKWGTVSLPAPSRSNLLRGFAQDDVSSALIHGNSSLPPLKTG